MPVEQAGHLRASIDAGALAVYGAGVANAGRASAKVQAVGQAAARTGADTAAVNDGSGGAVATQRVGIARGAAGADAGSRCVADCGVACGVNAIGAARAAGNRCGDAAGITDRGVASGGNAKGWACVARSADDAFDTVCEVNEACRCRDAHGQTGAARGCADGSCVGDDGDRSGASLESIGLTSASRSSAQAFDDACIGRDGDAHAARVNAISIGRAAGPLNGSTVVENGDAGRAANAEGEI